MPRSVLILPARWRCTREHVEPRLVPLSTPTHYGVPVPFDEVNLTLGCISLESTPQTSLSLERIVPFYGLVFPANVPERYPRPFCVVAGESASLNFACRIPYDNG